MGVRGGGGGVSEQRMSVAGGCQRGGVSLEGIIHGRCRC